MTQLALCGALAGCGSASFWPSNPAPAKPPEAAPGSDHGARNRAFADVTESPQREREVSVDPDERTLSAACGEGDAALHQVAAHLAEEQTEASRELDVDAISYALRAAGAPYVWPRAWLFSGARAKPKPLRNGCSVG